MGGSGRRTILDGEKLVVSAAERSCDSPQAEIISLTELKLRVQSERIKHVNQQTKSSQSENSGSINYFFSGLILLV